MAVVLSARELTRHYEVSRGLFKGHALVRALNEPLMRPLRRLIPPIAGVDLSPIVAFLLLRIILFAADNLLFHLIV